MSALFDILQYSYSSLIWGILIAAISLALFVFLIKGWYKDATFSPVSYIVGIILFVFLSFQCILIVGSLKIIDTTDYYEKEITSIVSNTYNAVDEITMRQADDIIKTVINEFPILQYYISGGEFSGFTAVQLPHAIAQELRSFMLWFILRRVLWCFFFVIVSAVCVIKTMSRHYTSERRQVLRQERKRVNRRYSRR